jgi:hypothetical protein
VIFKTIFQSQLSSFSCNLHPENQGGKECEILALSGKPIPITAVLESHIQNYIP